MSRGYLPFDGNWLNRQLVKTAIGGNTCMLFTEIEFEKHINLFLEYLLLTFLQIHEILQIHQYIYPIYLFCIYIMFVLYFIGHIFVYLYIFVNLYIFVFFGGWQESKMFQGINMLLFGFGESL